MLENDSKMQNNKNKHSSGKLFLAIITTFCLTVAACAIVFDFTSRSAKVRDVKPQKETTAENDSEPIDQSQLLFDDDDVKKALFLQEFIEDNYYIDTDKVDFTSGVYHGIFKSLNDPYSVYMTADEFKKFNELSTGSYGGIGVVVEAGKDNYITVVSPIEDTPGEKAGLVTGDKIIAVNGEDVYADTMTEAINMIKGEPGTDVTLTIYRAEDGKFDVTLTREMIVIKSVKSRMLDNGIGYIRISSFDQKVYSEFVEHYQALLTKGMKSLVIDLRNNPGGDLGQCVELTDYLLGEQLIVYTDNNKGKKQEYKSDADKIEVPFVLLVNGGSASASEVLTGAAKDTNSTTVIGTTTFGKGLVQTVYPLADGSGVKLTTAQYFTPNGTYIHGKGIEPNIVVELSEDYVEGDDSTDNQLQEAIRVLSQP